jgi:hypothetical protein
LIRRALTKPWCKSGAKIAMKNSREIRVLQGNLLLRDY